MFGRKKKTTQIEKPNKFRIKMKIDTCKQSIQGILNEYETKIEGYLTKMTNLKKENRFNEAENYKAKLKTILVQQAVMNKMMDRVDEFSFMVDQMLANISIATNFNAILTEVNKIANSESVTSMIKGMDQFQRTFIKESEQFNGTFDSISRLMNEANVATESMDAEIDAIVNSRLDQYDTQTTMEAENSTSTHFDLD